MCALEQVRLGEYVVYKNYDSKAKVSSSQPIIPECIVKENDYIDKHIVNDFCSFMSNSAHFRLAIGEGMGWGVARVKPNRAEKKCYRIVCQFIAYRSTMT